MRHFALRFKTFVRVIPRAACLQPATTSRMHAQSRTSAASDFSEPLTLLTFNFGVCSPESWCKGEMHTRRLVNSRFCKFRISDHLNVCPLNSSYHTETDRWGHLWLRSSSYRLHRPRSSSTSGHYVLTCNSKLGTGVVICVPRCNVQRRRYLPTRDPETTSHGPFCNAVLIQNMEE